MAYKSKSKTFMEGGINLDNLKKAIEELEKLSSDQRKKLSDFLLYEDNLIKTKQYLIDKHNEFLNKNDISVEQFVMAHNIGEVFLQESVKGGDPALLFSDICENANIEPQKDEDDFSTYKFIDAFIKHIDKLKIAALRKSSASSSIPNIMSVSYVCDARIVLEKKFDIFKDDLESYSPKKIGFEPVGIVSLTTDEDNTIHFQMSLDGLELIIKVLSSMKKTMKLVEENIRSSESEG